MTTMQKIEAYCKETKICACGRCPPGTGDVEILSAVVIGTLKISPTIAASLGLALNKGPIARCETRCRKCGQSHGLVTALPKGLIDGTRDLCPPPAPTEN
jgi:hypothetical protein